MFVVRIGDYDGMFDRYELVERPNDRTAVRWTCYRAIWPTRPRDFVIKSTWEEFADGTIVIATKSMEHERYPETPTFVRGKMVRRRTTVRSYPTPVVFVMSVRRRFSFMCLSSGFTPSRAEPRGCTRLLGNSARAAGGTDG